MRKIDLHIHSCASSKKDGNKVKNNTIQNISTLVKNLDSQKVNICSITDHDAFSYDMYQALKKSENKNNSIEKVLPGVEFSVRFKNESSDEKVIHVIAIFSDENDEKVKNIFVMSTYAHINSIACSHLTYANFILKKILIIFFRG